MRDGGRISAAIEILREIDQRHRPARLALKDWGTAARYAGARDRAFVSGLVLDTLRRRRSLAWRMDDEGERAAVLGALAHLWGWEAERIAAAAEEAHGPGALTEPERTRLADPRPLKDAPAPVGGDYPDWLEAAMIRVFGEGRAEEGAALAGRAPLDLRVNTLKTDTGRALKALAAFGARASSARRVAPEDPCGQDGRAPDALRVDPGGPWERAPAVEATPAFEKGWFEIQDLGSQIAAAAAGEIAGAQVLDFCAGGGGKTLALAAMMRNTGQIFAHDADPRRLADTVRRARRAGVRNLQVRAPGGGDPLAELAGRMDLVFVDAPCTGSGVWRRHPDAKWRLTPAQLERRIAEQDQVLSEAARFVKTGGRLLYVTCSVFAEENEDGIADFLAGHPDFAPGAPPRRLTPLRDACDGFFIAPLVRAP